MSLVDMIRSEHEEFMKMLAQLSDSGIEDVDVRIEVFPDLQMRVDIHAKAEERTLYHALREEDDTKELALEAIEHHRVARVLMVELRNIRVDDELWLPKMRMIRSVLEGHFIFEEEVIIPVAMDVVGSSMDEWETKFMGIEKELLRNIPSR